MTKQWIGDAAKNMHFCSWGTKYPSFLLLFHQIAQLDRRNQAPQVQENWFVCILKQIVSFSQCYQMTRSDLPGLCNGWRGFEIRPQLSRRTLSCRRVRISRPNGITFPSPGGQDRAAGTIWHQIGRVEFGEWRCPSAMQSPRIGGVISELCLFVGTLSWKPLHQLHVNLVGKWPDNFVVVVVCFQTAHTVIIPSLPSAHFFFFHPGVHSHALTSKSQIHRHKHVA